MEGFFDEKSGKWIKIYKGIIIVEFWLMIAAAVVLCFVGWADELYWTDSAFIDGILALIAGCVGAVIFLVPNMLILQLLNNIQIIREKAETFKISYNIPSNPKPVAAPQKGTPVRKDNGNTAAADEVNPKPRADAPKIEATPTASVIACPSCGKTQFSNTKRCFNCGCLFE